MVIYRNFHKRNPAKNPGGSSFNRGWQVIYSGFVLIMLSFFIMLCSFSAIQPAKITRFVKSFSNAVNILSGGIHFSRGRTELIKAVELVSPHDELADLFHDVEVMVAQLDLEAAVRVALTEKGLVMQVSDAAVFDSGASEIRPDAFPLMNRIGEVVARTRRVVRIQGHTDNRPIHTRRFPSNWELSTARAVEVLRYFMDVHRVPATRMVAVGYGEYHPVESNDSVTGRARNRRVEIIITGKRPKG